jgi:hypothetical protein
LDIKPSNLMLTEDGRVKIVDFGLSRKNSDTDQSKSGIVGTPCYVAPEQIREGFIHSLLQHRSILPEQARKILAEFPDSQKQYDSLMRTIDFKSRQALRTEIRDLALRILQGLFRMSAGDFVFEEGEVTGQLGLELDAREVLVKGVKEWMLPDIIQQRLPGPHSIIELNPSFQSILAAYPVSSADAFILFRFDHSIRFEELVALSGGSEKELCRTLYLFRLIGAIELLPQKCVSSMSPSRPKTPTRTRAIA